MISNVLKKIFIFPVKIYKWFISPILTSVFGPSCRYEPSCSTYMIQAIEEWGPIRGTYLGLKRIARCNPWGGHGHDPVPKKDESHINKC